MSTLRNTLTAATLLLVSSLAALAMQQDAYREVGDGAKPVPPQPQPQVVRDFNVKLDPNGVNSTTFSLGYHVTPDKQAQYREALDAFRTAPDGQDKEAKKAELKKQLTEIFEADMKARKAQADEIETRLKKLQEQYKAREAAKERIIDLQIEVLEKDAAGLGFPKGYTSNKAEQFSGKPNPELTLVNALRREGGAAQDLRKRGLFVVSEDRRCYAVVAPGSNPSHATLYLFDSRTGAMLAKYEPEGEIAEIRFQEGGVGVRMPEGKFEVRIPLKTPAKSDAASSSSQNPPDDPSFHPLGTLKQHNPESLDQLRRQGHFVETVDGKYYALALFAPPSGPTMIYLIDSATGQKVSRAIVEKPVSQILFTDEGVTASEYGKKQELKIPFDKKPEAKSTAPAAEELSNSSDIPFTVNSKSGEVVDYSKLRKEYLTAKRLVEQARKELNDKLIDVKKSKPDISDDELKAIEQSSESYRESIKSRLQEATMILETKIKLLTLDLESARASFNVAEAELAKSRQINENKPNAINEIELRRLQLTADRQKVEVMRAQTILDLFQSIKTDGEPKPDAAKELKR